MFFWVSNGRELFFNVNNKRPVFLSAKVVFSCSESAGYSSGSIGFVFNWMVVLLEASIFGSILFLGCFKNW